MSAHNPDHYAVVIGIDKYSSLPPLRSAVADAIRFAEWLLRVGGVPASQIYTVKSPARLASDDDLVSPAHKHVTKELQRLGVFKALEQERPEDRRIGRRLYFYFSGHGFGPNPGDVGMLMADATKVFLNRNMGLLPYRMLFLNSGVFEEVIYILDCCRDDERVAPITGPEFQPPPRSGLPVKEFVVLAAGWGSKAFEADQAFMPAGPADAAPVQRSGMLTQALIEGLGLDNPPKALDPLGRVTTTMLLAYLQARVPQLAMAAELSQLPRADGDGAVNPIVLATFPLDPAQAVTLRVNRTLPQVQIGTLLLLQKLVDRTEVEVTRLDPDVRQAGQAWEVRVRPEFDYVLKHAETRLELEIDLRDAEAGGTKIVDFPF